MSKPKRGKGQFRSPVTGTGVVSNQKSVGAPWGAERNSMTTISQMGVRRELSPKRTAIITDKLKAH